VTFLSKAILVVVALSKQGKLQLSNKISEQGEKLILSFHGGMTTWLYPGLKMKLLLSKIVYAT
jgi:hypothetical protein